MGTYFHNDVKTRSAMVKELTGDDQFMAYHLNPKANHLWVVVNNEQHGRQIGLYILYQQDGTWGYKPLDETMGLYQTDCPKRLLKHLGPPINEYSRIWRHAVMSGLRPEYR